MADLEALGQRLSLYAAQQPTRAQIEQRAREHEQLVKGIRTDFVGFVVGGAAMARNILRERRAPADSFELAGENINTRRVGGYVLREGLKYGARKPPHQDSIELPDYYRRRHRLARTKLIVLQSSGRLAIVCGNENDKIVDGSPSSLAWFRQEAVQSEEDGQRYITEAETDMNNMLTTYIARI